MFKFNPLFLADGYKIGHKKMLAPGTTKLYGTFIPRSIKRAPKGITKIISFGQQLVWKWIHDEFEENFFFRNILIEKEHPMTNYYGLKSKALQFVKDMSLYLGMEYDGKHFEELWDLGYLPIKVKALPEGIETDPNIPHMTFINTVDGFAWLTLFLETIISNMAWKPSTAATIAKLYRRQAEEWVKKTDPNNMWLVDYMCHDFSARGLSGWFDMVLVGLGHATSFRGSDTLMVIPSSRYYYNESENEVVINSVNASEHSVSCTRIFYYEEKLKKGELNNKITEYYSFDLPADGDVENPDYLAISEWLMLGDWLKEFPTGILSYVCDTFNTWKSVTHIIPRLKNEILNRNGKLVVRPDSGNPVDIICGESKVGFLNYDQTGRAYPDNPELGEHWHKTIWKNDDKYYRLINLPRHAEWDEIIPESKHKGVIEILWDIFGGTVNEQGFKVLDPHIGAIYGDSITPEKQHIIYQKLADKKFAATNIVLGIGSFTYQYNTRDTFSWAAKGAWFQVEEEFLATPESVEWGVRTKSYNIYKDPITDSGTKKSLKGLLKVYYDDSVGTHKSIILKEECTEEEESQGLLQVIYEDGNFFNQTTLTEIRDNLKNQ
jgi:nicotinamide phosphoribosyltransferase